MQHTPARDGSASSSDPALLSLSSVLPPDHTCSSLSCLRSHCRQLSAMRDSADGDLLSTPTTSPFSGSPTSTRSGTSPGYANDWAERQEKLVIHANQPTKERIDKTVRKLHATSIKREKPTTEQDTSTHDSRAQSPFAAAAITPPPSLPSSSSSSGDSLSACLLSPSKLLQRRQQRHQQKAADRSDTTIVPIESPSPTSRPG